MFTVKIIKKSEDTGDKIEILRETTKVTQNQEEVGLQSPDNGNVFTIFKKQGEFDTMYVMNDKGITVDIIYGC